MKTKCVATAMFVVPILSAFGFPQEKPGLQGTSERTEPGALGKVTKKVPITARVFQVVDKGLLFSMGGTTYLLAGHPDAKKLAEGDPVNCYAERIEPTYTYTDVRGAERTVRVYRYLNQRLGQR